MFGGVSINLIEDIMRKDGYMYQLSLPLCPPEYTLPKDYFSTIPVGYEHIEEYTGSSGSSISSVSHPGFEKLRDLLEAKGYIKTQRMWHNGDVVLKPFKLNDKWFEEGEQFPSAPAMKIRLKHK